MLLFLPSLWSQYLKEYMQLFKGSFEWTNKTREQSSIELIQRMVVRATFMNDFAGIL